MGVREQPKFKKADQMKYMSNVAMRVASLEKFTAGWEDSGRAASLEVATDAWATQIIMGGERSGAVNVVYMWDSIDSAVDGVVSLRSDERILTTLADAGAQFMSRNLIRIDQVFGDMKTGKYATVLTSTGNQPSPADQKTAADRVWSTMSGAGANGQIWGQMISAGPQTGHWILGTSTDSLDKLMTGTASVMTNPDQIKFMTDHNIALTGRTIGHRLG